MRILRLISSADPLGGGVIEGVRMTTEALLARGCEVDVVSLDDPAAAANFQLNIPITAVGPAKSGYCYCSRLDSWLNEHLSEYDAAITEGIWQYNSFALWRASRRLGKQAPPYFVFTHGMLDPWFKRTYPLKHLKKWLYWPWAEYRVLRDAHAVLFTAEEERVLARQSFWLYRANERIVHYGAPMPEAPSAARLAAWRDVSPLAHGRPYLLYLGRLHPKKGADLLIQAYRKLKADGGDWPALVLAGPEQDAAFTRRLKTLAGDDADIHFVGMVHGAAKWGALMDAEAMVLPSHQENFGIVVAEAMAMSAPVLISDKINIWREVETADAGLVCTDTLDGVQAMLRRLQSLSPEERNSMRNAAQLCYAKHFTVDRCAEQLLEVLGS